MHSEGELGHVPGFKARSGSLGHPKSGAEERSEQFAGSDAPRRARKRSRNAEEIDALKAAHESDAAINTKESRNCSSLRREMSHSAGMYTAKTRLSVALACCATRKRARKRENRAAVAPSRVKHVIKSVQNVERRPKFGRLPDSATTLAGRKGKPARQQ
ncbi:hypothetical protein B0H17DRAFT_1141601 [Mycena rosella]|uniref:Uncharacterized protein n=1 Tax=Mycena rosella TaxID=1033263 RepID=A0AAD7GAG3_MYCRO|nr:hypothetical protein B0H17DRAFT_1141601 [Mycena rosella]